VTSKVVDVVNQVLSNTKLNTDRENQIRDDKQLRLEQQLKDLLAHSQSVASAHTSLASTVGDLKIDIKHLNQEISKQKNELSVQKQEISTLKLGSATSMPHNFNADWTLVFDFFMRNTVPSVPPIVGGSLEDTVRDNSSVIKKLVVDIGTVSSTSGSGPSLTNSLSGGRPAMTTPGSLSTLEAQVLDLKARMSSMSVTIKDFTFPTLKGTCAWATANLPSSNDQACVCVDVVVLLHSIGRAFESVDETRDTMCQNRRAGVSTMALTVASSFNTVLPQIMGKSRNPTGQDSGLVLPCAAKYSDWFDNSTGIPTGTKQQIVEGLETQFAVYDEAIRVLGYTHPVGAALSSHLLQRASDFSNLILSVVDTMWSEYLGRHGAVGQEEAWLVICAVIRQLFRELRGVRRPGAAIIAGSPSSIGSTWWYVLQTHRLMDDFTAAGIRRHSTIIPVFTAHLDRNRVTLTTHAALAEKVKRMETAVTSVTTSVSKLNGARGNVGGRGGGGAGAGAGVPGP
jgi:hypothetical protein